MQWKGLAALMLVVVPTVVLAQEITGTINGVVADTTGAVVPGVTIQIMNVGTGASRSVTTDEHGRYRVFNLAPGIYTVASELAGFSPVIRDNITVNISKEIAVDIVLELGQLTERVTVSGESSTVDLSSGAVVGVVTTQQIAELPLNGRSFIQLATLQPGISVARAHGGGFHGGYGNTQVSIGGARSEMTGYLIEGTNIADIADNAPSGVAGVLLGVDAVQEFSVQTHGYGAEYGRAAGGVISAVTKSGTNSLHGTGFGFFRNSALDASNFFDEEGVPPFQRSQFGATAGGPIVKNRLFFFGGYEGLRERLAQTIIARLPNRDAHNGYLPDGRGGLTFVGVHPDVKPYLDLLFPVPDGRDFGDGSAELVHAEKDPADEHFGVGKVDWLLNQKDSISTRLSVDVSNRKDTLANPLVESHTGTDTRYFMTQYQRLFTSNVLNVARVAINRTKRTLDSAVPLIEVPSSLYFTRTPYPGGLAITGLTGSPSGSPANYIQTLFQVNDSLTWSKGRHTMKFGFDAQRYHFHAYSFFSYGGDFRFRNLREFLTLTRSATAKADRFNGNLPGTDPTRDIRQTYFAAFAQDEFRVNDRVTLNYGLRYEFVTTPYDTEDRIAGLLSLDDLETGPKGVTPGSPLFNPPNPRFSPRLGLNWDPFGRGKTSVRSSFGLFTQPLTTSYYRGTVSRIFPYFAGVQIRQPPVFGFAVQALLDQREAGSPDVQKRSESLIWEAKQPYMSQYNVTVQHEFTSSLVAEIGYIGSHGYNLVFYGDPNSVPAEQMPDGRWRVVPGAGLRYPNWGRIRTKKNEAKSLYNGLTVGVKRRLENGLMLQASYTLGKSIDDWSAGTLGSNDYENGAGSASNFWCVECEHGLSNFDVRHTFVFNGMYLLPFGKNLTGVGGLLAKDWQVGVILNIASGVPFTPYVGWDRAGDRQSDNALQKPDVAPGYSGNPIIGSPDNWFDATAFVLPEAGYYGNAGRNTLTGPNLRTVDLSLMKNVPLGRSTLQFRAEAFNVLNRANFATPDAGALFNTDGTRRAAATRIIRTSTTSRQVQLGIKLLF